MCAKVKRRDKGNSEKCKQRTGCVLRSEKSSREKASRYRVHAGRAAGDDGGAAATPSIREQISTPCTGYRRTYFRRFRQRVSYFRDTPQQVIKTQQRHTPKHAVDGTRRTE